MFHVKYNKGSLFLDSLFINVLMLNTKAVNIRTL
nr:MAG TPA: hypothetical protein [Caudoviricetes sp.]